MLSEGVTMRVVRWNHSGDPSVNPEQHNPVELTAVPVRDAVSGGLRAGVAEDFPNGGGNRAYLFTVDGPDGQFSWFFSNSASAVDLPVHWDGLFGAFEAGVPKPYADSDVEAFLKASDVNLVKPAQYMDKWRLDRSGVRPVANTEVKKALGFN